MFLRAVHLPAQAAGSGGMGTCRLGPVRVPEPLLQVGQERGPRGNRAESNGPRRGHPRIHDDNRPRRLDAEPGMPGAAAVLLGLAYEMCLVSGLRQAEQMASPDERGRLLLRLGLPRLRGAVPGGRLGRGVGPVRRVRPAGGDHRRPRAVNDRVCDRFRPSVATDVGIGGRDRRRQARSAGKFFLTERTAVLLGAPVSQVRPGAKIPPKAPNTHTTRPQPTLTSPET